MSDPFFASVTLLALNESGSDASTTFIDQSNSAHTLTPVADFQWDTAQFPTGLTSSGLSDGTGDQLLISADASLGFGTGDFTIEGFLRYNVNTGTRVVIDLRSGSTRSLLYSTGTGSAFFYLTAAGNLVTATTPNTGVWTHFAVCRSGTTGKLFLAGSQVGGDFTDNANYLTPINARIADSTDAGASFNGWLASIRITKGVARYSANFTPPTLPLPTTALDPPVADFSGTPFSGVAPLNVAFTDASTNTPTSWAWTFGDGGTSTSQNPSHTYAAAGTYSVGLTATNAAGSNLLTKTNYIIVSAPPDTTRPSGGYYDAPDRRTSKEISEARRRVGIEDALAQEAIAEVAARQAERLELDAQKQYDELRGELLLRNIQIETRHLEELAAIRERLIGEEIASRLRMRLDMDALWMLVQIAAAC